MDFSIRKIHYKIFLGIFEQYVLADEPEGRFYATYGDSSFIALDDC